MTHTHEFDCKICGAHLDSRNELDQHNVKRHPETRSASEPSRERQNDPSDWERDRTESS